MKYMKLAGIGLILVITNCVIMTVAQAYKFDMLTLCLTILGAGVILGIVLPLD
jgi:hypothetical protein